MKSVAILLALAVSSAGCGGGEVAPTTSTDSTTAGSVLIRTVMTEYAYDPDLWLIDAGQAVEIVVDNQGTLEHNWAVLSSPITTEDEFDESLVLYLLAADPGQVMRDELPTLPVGDFQVICTIPGHFTLGQYGELRVSVAGGS